MEYPIAVNYEYTNNLYKAKQWLNNLPDLFAADFEVASKFTKKQKEVLKLRLENCYNNEKQRILLQQITSDGLSHPSLTVITHLSVGWTDRDSKVIVCDTERIRMLVLEFLITTDKRQLWHNCVFDFKHIFYNTGVLPQNYTDTQLLAKALLNDADSFKDRTGLKDLMGYAYGAWGISKDDFTLEEMWTEDMLKYAATDSPACFSLYQDIQKSLTQWKI